MAMAPRWGGWEGWRLSVGRVKGDLLRMVQSGACQRDWCSGRAWWAGCMGSGVSVFVVVHVCPILAVGPTILQRARHNSGVRS